MPYVYLCDVAVVDCSTLYRLKMPEEKKKEEKKDGKEEDMDVSQDSQSKVEGICYISISNNTSKHKSQQ